jgi:hypothetical protein
LGLGGYEVGEVIEEAKGIVVKVGTDSKMLACPHCDSAKSYRHGRARKGRLLVSAGDAAVVGIYSPKVQNLCVPRIVWMAILEH